MIRRRRLPWVVLFALALALASCNSSETHWNDDTPDWSVHDTAPSDAITDVVDPRPAIYVDDQRLLEPDMVVVRAVVVDVPAWLLISDTALPAGEDALLGAVSLDGSAPLYDVSVTLARELVDGERLRATLVADLGEVGTLEPQDLDAPLIGSDGRPIAVEFTVSLPAPVLVASPQTLSLSTVVTVSEADTLDAGWLVAHPVAADGTVDPSVVLGAASSSGTLATPTEPFELVLSAPLPDGATTLQLALYAESGDDPASFDAGVDPPLDARTTVEVTVPAGTPAVRLTAVAADTAQGYHWSATPAALADIAPTRGAALVLVPGWRYEVVNFESAAHPLELYDTTAAQSLLSQQGTGSLEDAPSIAWRELSADAFRFTFSAELAAVADAYRCVTHPTTMGGAVQVASP